MRPFAGLAHLAAHKGGNVDAAWRRPDPLLWIWYAFGGTLGPRYRQWVLRTSPAVPGGSAKSPAPYCKWRRWRQCYYSHWDSAGSPGLAWAADWCWR